MKVILYMATTINGFIDREDDSTPWSDEEWKAYAEMVKRVGNIIIGRKTYEIMKDGEFERIGNPFVIVMTQQKENDPISNVAFVQTPEEALKIVEEKGYTETMVNGGSTIIDLFAQKKFFDEIYFDVEPFVFGKGKPLFLPSNVELRLSLEEVKKIGNNSFQAHYIVLK